MQRSRLMLSMAFLLRTFFSAHSKAGGEGGGRGGREGKLDKRGVVLVGTILRKRPGLACAPGWIIRLEHSTATGVLFFFSFQRCFHSCVVQVHDMELCRHMTD